MPKRVLVTGGAGFIGHHVIDHLLRTTDWEIVSLDRLDFSGNLNRIEEVVSQYDVETRKRVTIVFHDLKAEINPQVRNAIGKVNMVFHIAAASHVDRSISFPMEFVLNNVVGTANVLDYARDYLPDLECFLYFSTDEVFGPAPRGVEYGEYARYNAGNPYAASKAGAEELCVAYHNTYKMPIVITHTMNVFGERQLPEKFIALCIRNVRDGKSITIHSDKTKTVPGSRFYIHASDVADALLHIVSDVRIANYMKEHPHLCPKFNVVGKQEIDNLELAQMIADAQKLPLIYEMVDFHSSRPGHDLRYALDGNLMRSLGWEPTISLTERIAQVTQWSLENDRWLKL